MSPIHLPNDRDHWFGWRWQVDIPLSEPLYAITLPDEAGKDAGLRVLHPCTALHKKLAITRHDFIRLGEQTGSG